MWEVRGMNETYRSYSRHRVQLESLRIDSVLLLTMLNLKIAVEISRRAAERLRAQRMSGILRI